MIFSDDIMWWTIPMIFSLVFYWYFYVLRLTDSPAPMLEMLSHLQRMVKRKTNLKHKTYLYKSIFIHHPLILWLIPIFQFLSPCPYPPWCTSDDVSGSPAPNCSGESWTWRCRQWRRTQSMSPRSYSWRTLPLPLTWPENKSVIMIC